MKKSTFKWKRLVLWLSLALEIPLSYELIRLISNDNLSDSHSRMFFIISLMIIVPVVCYRRLSWLAKRIDDRESIVVIIEDDFILRETRNEANKILKSEIVSVTRESDDGIRINDGTKNEMWIPSDIEGFGELEELIKKMLPFSSGNNQQEIQNDPTETISTYSQEIQNYLLVVSMLSVAIILLSYFQLHFYYSQFDISIYNYVNPSEIVFAFANQWKESIIIILFFIVFYRAFSWMKIKNPKNIVKNSEHKIGNFVAWTSMLLLAILIMYILVLTVDSSNNNSQEFVSPFHQFNILIVCFILVFSLVTALYTLTLFFKFRSKFVTLPLVFIALIISSLLLSVIEGKISYNLLTNGNSKYSIELSLSDSSVIKTSKDLVFIGSTSGFYFFLENGVNLIIPRTSIVKEKQELLRNGL